MLGLNIERNTKLWVSRWGTLCGVFAMVLFVAGCPTQPPCTEDADCDDGVFCNGVETCDLTVEPAVCVAGEVPCEADYCDEEAGVCYACLADDECDDANLCTDDACVEGVCENTDVDCGDQMCDPADGLCVDCLEDADCDDGLFCNGAETCVDGVCVAGTDPCLETEVCVEETAECITACVEAADCADEDVCTDDACVDGVCEYTDVDCDDGLFCTGVETCDPVDGCASPGDPCAEGETCDEETDACTDCVACTEDADCTDDGLFCNGTESCVDSCCVSSGDPCAADQACDEDNDECDALGCEDVEPYVLTTGTDTFTDASSCDDTFFGSRELSGGNWFMTLNNSDTLDGGLGTDSLSVETVGTATITPASLAGIEVLSLDVTDNTDVTFNCTYADALTTVNISNAASANCIVQNLQTVLTDVGLTNCDDNITITMDDADLTGSTDEITLTLQGMTDAGAEPVITIQPDAAGSGVEIFNVVSSGVTDNAIDDLVDGAGTTFATLNVSGSAKLTIGDQLNATVTTVNASTMTGDLFVTLGTNTATVTGGSGDDQFDFSTAAGDYTTVDTIDGGDGTDTLVLDDADADVTTTQSNVSNIETIEVDTAMGGDVNVAYFGATNFTAAAALGGATQITVAHGATYTAEAATGANQLTIACSTSSTEDTLIIDSKVNAANDFGGAVVLTDWENVTVNANIDAVSFDSTLALNSSASAETLTLAGNQAITFAGAVTCDTLDASGLTGALTLGAAMAAQSQVTGGSAADTILGSTSADILDGGAGNDIIATSGGSDNVTCGDGDDQVTADTLAADGSTVVTITDFAAGTASTMGDELVFDLSAIEALTAVTDLVDTGAGSTAAIADAGTFTAATLSTDGATITGADLVIISDSLATYANDTAALAAKTAWTITYSAALTDNDAFLIAYSDGNGNVRIAVAVSAGVTLTTSDGIDALYDIYVLEGVSLSNLNGGTVATDSDFDVDA